MSNEYNVTYLLICKNSTHLTSSIYIRSFLLIGVTNLKQLNQFEFMQVLNQLITLSSIN